MEQTSTVASTAPPTAFVSADATGAMIAASPPSPDNVLPISVAVVTAVVVLSLVVLIAYLLRNPNTWLCFTRRRSLGDHEEERLASATDVAVTILSSASLATGGKAAQAKATGLGLAEIASFPVMMLRPEHLQSPRRPAPAAGAATATASKDNHHNGCCEAATAEGQTTEDTATAVCNTTTPGVAAATTGPAWTGKACTVCLADFAPGELVRCLPACGHRFHVSCIDLWLSARVTCPVCRTCLKPGGSAPGAEEKKETTKECGVGEANEGSKVVVVVVNGTDATTALPAAAAAASATVAGDAGNV
eukprot:TRINITY_DN3222_c0_g1_i2.p2 TRINITY_DN3222_c0_g1~~TRINITY_DN3222_c0_g1_i2.p2  ORF type:complete len:305 (+),score=-0.25 TRINITY_DN3222_c0_g1_i2:1641-2555(+)